MVDIVRVTEPVDPLAGGDRILRALAQIQEGRIARERMAAQAHNDALGWARLAEQQRANAAREGEATTYHRELAANRTENADRLRDTAISKATKDFQAAQQKGDVAGMEAAASELAPFGIKFRQEELGAAPEEKLGPAPIEPVRPPDDQPLDPAAQQKYEQQTAEHARLLAEYQEKLRGHEQEVERYHAREKLAERGKLPVEIVHEKTGKVYHRFDPAEYEAQARANAEAGAGQFAEAAKGAGRSERQGALEADRLYGILRATGMPELEARTRASKAAQATAAQFHADERARMVAAAATARMRIGEDWKKNAQFMQLMKDEERENHTNELNEEARQAESLIKLSRVPNPIAQKDAIMALVKSQQGSRPTDKDLAYVQESAGKWVAAESRLNAWVNGGQLPQTFRQDMQDLGDIKRKIIQAKKHEVGLKTKAAADSMFGEDYGDFAYGYVTGQFGGQKALPTAGDRGTSVTVEKKTSKTEKGPRPEPTKPPPLGEKKEEDLY